MICGEEEEEEEAAFMALHSLDYILYIYIYMSGVLWFAGTVASLINSLSLKLSESWDGVFWDGSTCVTIRFCWTLYLYLKEPSECVNISKQMWDFLMNGVP